jgi:hypothetical protein
MKKILVLIPFLALLVASCTKNKDVVYDHDPVVEWDAATFNAKSAGYPFPLLTRNPLAFGRGVYASAPQGTSGVTADPALTRTIASPNDTVRLRVNLVGPQMTAAQSFSVRVNQTFTTGVEGTHFELIDRTVTIPAGQSFGVARWRVLNPGTPPAGSLPAVNVVFELTPSSEVKVSENYKYIGFSITQ